MHQDTACESAHSRTMFSAARRRSARGDSGAAGRVFIHHGAPLVAVDTGGAEVNETPRLAVDVIEQPFQPKVPVAGLGRRYRVVNQMVGEIHQRRLHV
jgi:hypothetical protein